MLVDRHFIAKNFRGRVENSDLVFDHSQLIDIVNYWKAIFVEKHNLKRGDKIALMYALIDIFYFGAVIAAAELGVKLVVTDMVYNSEKMDLYFPLNVCVTHCDTKFKGLEIIEKNSLNVEDYTIFDTYQIQNPPQWQDYILRSCDPDDILMLCTSSGTTGKPKAIQHSHAFMAAIAKRNSELFKFKGQVCHTKSLHHGSSLAVYFLPALYSDQVDCHHLFNIHGDHTIKKSIKYCVDMGINHIQLSYRKECDLFLKEAIEQGATFEDLTIYTLGYIDPQWQDYLKKIGNVKIISFFGCNEISGVFMTATLEANSENFDPKRFTLCDDFYKVEQIEDHKIKVTVPVYENFTFVLQDRFIINGREFYHLGRDDMFRIGETEIDSHWFLTLANQLKIDGDLVFDPMKQHIYYADWGTQNSESNYQRLNSELLSKYNIPITDWKVLDYKSYLYGIKIDHALIREAFR